MGWLFMEKPTDVKKYLVNNLTWETESKKNTCLDIAMKLNVAYAAVETIDKESGDREVWAAVFLMKYIRGDDPYNWGYKDLTECCGPVEADCPARILDLLTTTNHEYAIEWRRRCRKAIEKKMPKIGTRVRFAEPVRFGWGEYACEETEFTVVRYGKRKKVLRGRDGGLFRVSRRVWQNREWQAIESAVQEKRG